MLCNKCNIRRLGQQLCKIYARTEELRLTITNQCVLPPLGLDFLIHDFCVKTLRVNWGKARQIIHSLHFKKKKSGDHLARINLTL